MACKLENNLPNNNWWNRVLTVGGEDMDTPGGIYPNLSKKYFTLGCQHCTNPACTRVCPVGATYKREEDGVVFQDYDKCIGCRMCMAACPYTGVRNFNWEEPQYYVGIQTGSGGAPTHKKHTVEKCTLCAHRLARGEEPACCQDSICPGRARYFGDFDDPSSKVSQLLARYGGEQLLSDMQTEPNIYYIDSRGAGKDLSIANAYKEALNKTAGSEAVVASH
jgi:molybdopterin-containing oxidoreductase family iron-sulfur binding subunit